MSESDQLNQKAREIWNTNAAWWDDKYGEGKWTNYKEIPPVLVARLRLI